MLAALVAGAVPSWAAEMVPHRAIYGMALHSAEQGSSVTGAGGTMVYVFRDECEGWSAETNVKMQLVYAEGDEIDTDWSFASWESKDGTSYQFRTRQARDGNEIESLNGKVRRARAGDAATARFTEPDGETIPMPNGTLFPTRHLMEVLKAGAAGAGFLSRTVFDGASLDNPYIITAVRGRRSPPEAVLHAGDFDDWIKELGLKPEQPVHYRMAFFSRDSKEALPEFELGIDYRSDGIARFIRQDYGDFSVDLQLRNIELIKKPDC